MKILSIVLICFLPIVAHAQDMVMYNGLLSLNTTAESQGQSHYVVGNFKVKGSPYLLNSTLKMTLYGANNAKLQCDSATYDTYYQKIETLNFDKTAINTFDLTNVDSFTINDNKTISNFNVARKFVNGSKIDGSSKFFVEELASNPTISFYKLNNATLEDYVSGYVQTTGFKTFKQVFEYYYLNPSAKKLTKFTLNEKGLKKCFGNTEGINNLINSKEFYENAEGALINFIKNN